MANKKKIKLTNTQLMCLRGAVESAAEVLDSDMRKELSDLIGEAEKEGGLIVDKFTNKLNAIRAKSVGMKRLNYYDKIRAVEDERTIAQSGIPDVDAMKAAAGSVVPIANLGNNPIGKIVEAIAPRQFMADSPSPYKFPAFDVVDGVVNGEMIWVDDIYRKATGFGFEQFHLRDKGDSAGWDMVYELHGVKTGNEAIAKLVAPLRVRSRELSQALFDNGAIPRIIENYVHPSWNPVRMAGGDNGASFKKWHLDRGEPDAVMHPNPEETLDAWFENVVYTPEGEGAREIALGGAIEIHYSKPENRVEAMRLFGSQTPMEIIENTFGRRAGQAALTRLWGPRPYDRMREFLEEAGKRANVAGADPRQTQGLLDRTRMIVNHRAGAFRGKNPGTVYAFQTAANMPDIVKLQNLPVYTLQDLASLGSLMSRLKGAGGYQKALTASLAHLSPFRDKSISAETRREVARRLGFVQAYSSGAMLNEYASTGFLQGYRSKTGSRFEIGATAAAKITGRIGVLSRLFDGTKRLIANQQETHALMFSQHLTMRRSLSFKELGKIDPVLQQRFAKFGINEQKWDALRDEANFVNLEGDLHFEPMLVKDVAVRDAFYGFANWESHAAQLRPDQYIQAWTHKYGGDIGGQLWTALWKYQTSQFAVQRLLYTRALREGGAPAVLALSAAMLSASAAAVQSIQVIRNEPLYEWDSAYYWGAAFAMSGIGYLSTVMGYELMLMYERGRINRGNIEARDFAEKTTGPLLNEILKGANLGIDTSLEMYKYGDFRISEKTADRWIRYISSNAIPIPKLWWSSWLTHKVAVDAISEQFTPDALDSRKRREENDRERLGKTVDWR